MSPQFQAGSGGNSPRGPASGTYLGGAASRRLALAVKQLQILPVAWGVLLRQPPYGAWRRPLRSQNPAASQDQASPGCQQHPPGCTRSSAPERQRISLPKEAGPS